MHVLFWDTVSEECVRRLGGSIGGSRPYRGTVTLGGGSCDARFEAVREAFADHFDDGEIGAA